MHSRRAFGLRAFVAKLRGAVSGQRDGDEFEAEVGEHLRLLTERFVAQGISRDEAALAARRQFGNTILLQEDRRALQTLPSLDGVLQDTRFAFRLMTRHASGSAIILAVASRLRALSRFVQVARPRDDYFSDPNARWLVAIGRRHREYSLAQVRNELAMLARVADEQVAGRTTSLIVTDGSVVQDPEWRPRAPIIMAVTLGTIARRS